MTSSPRPPISACIITLDEADRIEDCIRSLAFCEEILVVDSGSKDGTAQRAVALGARVVTHPFEGYRAQKEFAVRTAKHDWTLCLDADERVTPALRASIEGAGFSAAGYRFARSTEYFGAFLRHGNAYPDRVLRLFDRRRGGWLGDREIHEHASVEGEVVTLSGDLEHRAYRSLTDQLSRLQKYARLMALDMHRRGRRASSGQSDPQPVLAFFSRLCPARRISRRLARSRLCLGRSQLHAPEIHDAVAARPRPNAVAQLSRGKRSVNCAPPPARSSARIAPPCSSAIFFATARPRPVPFALLVV